MEHIYIFDYSSGSIYHGILDENEEISDFYERHGLKESNCYDLVTDKEITIEEL